MKRSRRSWAAVSGGELMYACIVYKGTLCQEVTKIPYMFSKADWHSRASATSPPRVIPVWSGRYGQKQGVRPSNCRGLCRERRFLYPKIGIPVAEGGS